MEEIDLGTFVQVAPATFLATWLHQDAGIVLPLAELFEEDRSGRPMVYEGWCLLAAMKSESAEQRVTTHLPNEGPLSYWMATFGAIEHQDLPRKRTVLKAKSISKGPEQHDSGRSADSPMETLLRLLLPLNERG
jgi:hypothetical protein